MELEEIIGLAKRNRAGRELSDKLTQDSSTNAIYEFVANIEGRLNDPAVAPLLAASLNMAPAGHRTHLENSLNTYKKELIDAVTENTKKAVEVFRDNEIVGAYLLSSPLKPAVYGGVSDDWVEKYASARESFIFLNRHRENPEKDMPKKVDAYIKEQIDYLKNKKASAGIISGILWVYNNHPELAQKAVLIRANDEVKKFVGELNVDEGKNYILDRANKLEGKDKSAEAYRIGQALA